LTLDALDRSGTATVDFAAVASDNCSERLQIMSRATAMPTPARIDGMVGFSAQRKVFLGYAPARLLHALSFADILDEDTGRGYQRRFNPKHSLDFRRYIQSPHSSTIPLTFNLRPQPKRAWKIVIVSPLQARLEISRDSPKVLAQVDCQHRLGHLNDLDVSLPFMCYLGLSEREEMEIFNVINSKAKGLSTSLLDFHDATLATDLAADRPELFIALQLNNNSDSSWYRQLDLGGTSTSGLMRRASLRTMQKAVKRFLTQTKLLNGHQPDAAARIVLDFWSAVAIVLRDAFDNPRKHLIHKGVGVYALMNIAADLYAELESDEVADKQFFVNKLGEFLAEVNWASDGPLSGFGGEGGVKSALAVIRSVRTKNRLRAAHG
jgi:DNA sulfur modification protein DndB